MKYLTRILGCLTLLLAANAAAIPIFSSSDTIWGGQLSGNSFVVGRSTGGFTSGVNRWPRDENPRDLIDGFGYMVPIPN